jgi:hypothetical protein
MWLYLNYIQYAISYNEILNKISGLWSTNFPVYILHFLQDCWIRNISPMCILYIVKYYLARVSERADDYFRFIHRQENEHGLVKIEHYFCLHA